MKVVGTGFSCASLGALAWARQNNIPYRWFPLNVEGTSASWEFGRVSILEWEVGEGGLEGALQEAEAAVWLGPPEGKRFSRYKKAVKEQRVRLRLASWCTGAPLPRIPSFDVVAIDGALESRVAGISFASFHLFDGYSAST